MQTNGDAAAIYDWDTKRGKYVQKDRLTDADLKRASKNATMLTGFSDHLVNEVGVVREEARLNLKLLHDQAKPLTYG